MASKRGPVIAVVNMKGGVGKTTISANVFRELFRTHIKNTLLIDFDPQYNLSQLLLTRMEYEKLRDEHRTLWHVLNPDETPSIFRVSDNDLMKPGPTEQYIRRLRSIRGSQPIVRLDLLPGDFRTAMINLMTETAALRVRRQRFHEFVQESRMSYDLVVIDCNPSSSFMTRAAIEAASHLLIPVRADRYSILGLEMLTEYVRALPGIERPPESVVLVNDLAGAGGQNEVIDQLRSHPEYGPRTLAATLNHSKVLEARASYSGFAVDKGVAYTDTVRRRLKAVADELAVKVGIQ
jgi:chromosome partitioning protein